MLINANYRHCNNTKRVENRQSYALSFNLLSGFKIVDLFWGVDWHIKGTLLYYITFVLFDMTFKIDIYTLEYVIRHARLLLYYFHVFFFSARGFAHDLHAPQNYPLMVLLNRPSIRQLIDRWLIIIIPNTHSLRNLNRYTAQYFKVGLYIFLLFLKVC